MDTKTIHPNLQKLLNAVEAVLKLPKERIDPDAELASFGMDSIIALEVLGYLSKKEAIQISPAQMASVENLRQLAEVLLPVSPEFEMVKESENEPVAKANVSEVVRHSAEINPLSQLIRSQYGIDVELAPDMTIDDAINFLMDHHEDKLQRFYNLQSATSPIDVELTSVMQNPGYIGNNCISDIVGIHVKKEGSQKKSRTQEYFNVDFFGVPDTWSELLSPVEKDVLKSVYRALEDAGIKPSMLTGKRVGVFLGVDDPVASNIPAKICAVYDWCGPVETHQMRESGINAALAVCSAAKVISNNGCDLAVVIGIDSSDKEKNKSIPDQDPVIAVVILRNNVSELAKKAPGYGQIILSGMGYCGSTNSADLLRVDAFQHILEYCYLPSHPLTGCDLKKIVIANIGSEWKRLVEKDLLEQFYCGSSFLSDTRNIALIDTCSSNCQGLMAIVDSLVSNPEQTNQDLNAINFLSDTGTLCHLVIKGGQERSIVLPQKDQYIFVLSSHSLETLQQLVKDYQSFLSENNCKNFDGLIYSLQMCREIYDYRLAIICSDQLGLIAQLDRLLSQFSTFIGQESDPHLFVACCGSDQPWIKLVSDTMLQAEFEICEKTNNWQSLARLWVLGAQVDWSRLWSGSSQIVHGLPVYPFADDAGDHVHVVSKSNLHYGKFVPIWQRKLIGNTPAQSAISKSILFETGKIISQVSGLPLEKLATDRLFDELTISADCLKEIVLQLEKFWNIRISPVAVQARRTWQNLAELVERALPISEELLIELQPCGDSNPFFALPGAGGSVNVFNPLAKALGRYQSLWGIQSPGVSGNTSPIGSVEVLAAINLALLQKVQKSGPYQFVGYSNGGVVAFEMARQLIEQGEQIERLIMIDSVSPFMRVNDVDEEMTKVCNDLLATLSDTTRIKVDELKAIPLNSRCDYLFQLLKREGFALPYEHFSKIYELIMTSDAACRSYRPSPVDLGIPIELFSAQEGYLNLPEDYGWRELNSQGVEVIKIDANHVSIMHDLPSNKMAKLILNKYEDGVDKQNRHDDGADKQKRKSKRQGNSRAMTE